MSLPVPYLSKQAISKMVCNTGPSVRGTITVNDTQYQLVQVVGWITTVDGMDTICLSDGDHCYPFSLSAECKRKVSPYCLIRFKKLTKWPFDDPGRPGIPQTMFRLEEIDVEMNSLGAIVGNPIDLRKHLYNFDIPFSLVNYWDRDWWPDAWGSSSESDGGDD
jgi:hypothetical protein